MTAPARTLSEPRQTTASDHHIRPPHQTTTSDNHIRHLRKHSGQGTHLRENPSFRSPLAPFAWHVETVTSKVSRKVSRKTNPRNGALGETSSSGTVSVGEVPGREAKYSVPWMKERGQTMNRERFMACRTTAMVATRRLRGGGGIFRPPTLWTRAYASQTFLRGWKDFSPTLQTAVAGWHRLR